MSRRSHILVVSTELDLITRVRGALPAPDFRVLVVPSFEAARERLTSATDMVIAQLKLEAYNGLHLAIHARSLGIPALVIGEPQAALDGDVARCGATYIPTTVPDCDSIAFMVGTLLDATGAARATATRVA